jgi:hypothetical protein
MANKDLFKQAIAEAKSVREAAIANAKEALEETLTPHLKDMLAAKLQEMEDSTVEEEVVNEIEGEVEEGMDKDKKDEAIEEDIAEVEEAMEGEDDADHDSEESDEEAEDDLEVKDMEVDDLKDLIRDIIAQEMGDGAADDELPVDDMPADDMVGADDEEEIDLDELLKEIAEISEEDKKEKKMEEEVEEGKKEEMDEAKHDDDMDEAMHHDKKDEAMHHDKKDEAMHDDKEKMEEAPLNEFGGVDPVTVALGIAAVFGGSALTVKLMDDAKAGKYGDMGKKIAAHFEEMGKAAGDAVHHRREEVEEAMKDKDMDEAMKDKDMDENTELEEAMETITNLKGQLQEVNLLNAKLLYVNKVFKANNLTESQKVNVIAAFDKAETVKEVKLVFETVADNVVTKSTKSTIKEAKLGMASKATGTTASKPEVIAEVSDTVRRMQKLAGIIK